MLSSFISYVQKEKLLGPKQRTLLAVSGGVDSIVMCELFRQAGFPFGIAHCNFSLRGKESDEDEAFVEELAEKYGAAFYMTSFDTTAYAKKNKLSIQAAARALRYDWFSELAISYGYDHIATAHHRDDSIETFFINLIRGTGISGLHGILPRQENIIRPLLFTSKQEILAFAKKHKLAFREDSSNASDNYVRNKIRHHVIPLLKELNPDIAHTLLENMERLGMTEAIYLKEIENQRKKLIVKKGDSIVLPIASLRKLEPLPAYLFEFFRPFGFNAADVRDIILSLDKHSGKQFFSDKYRLIRDRQELILQEIDVEKDQEHSHIRLPKGVEELSLKDLRLSFIKKKRNTKTPIPKLKTTAALDLDKLEFPLELRKWKTGDHFYPLGMKGKKKLSDFFVDQKFSLAKKEKTWLLLSEGNIVWVIGERIDDRFKVGPDTKQIYFVHVH
jgi:tRNA(Ile)-lysidine synthase